MKLNNLAIICLTIVSAKMVKNAINSYHYYDTYTIVTNTVKDLVTFASVKSYYEDMPMIDPVINFGKHKSKKFKRVKLDTFIEPKKIAPKQKKTSDEQYF